MSARLTTRTHRLEKTMGLHLDGHVLCPVCMNGEKTGGVVFHLAGQAHAPTPTCPRCGKENAIVFDIEVVHSADENTPANAGCGSKGDV